MGNLSYSKGVSEELVEKQYTVEVMCDPDTGQAVHETWHDENGLRNRPGDLPAFIGYSQETGQPVSFKWYKDDTLHRGEDKPASLLFDAVTGVIKRETYLVGGVEHRHDDQPAVIWRWPNGELKECEYYQNGLRHRDEGPAVEKYHPDTGTLLEKEYWKKGVEFDTTMPQAGWQPD